MSAAEDVAAAGKEEPRDDTVFGVDAVREHVHGFAVAMVDIGEGGIADTAGEDDVEGRDIVRARRGRRLFEPQLLEELHEGKKKAGWEEGKKVRRGGERLTA
jgi:hypothetical protein